MLAHAFLAGAPDVDAVVARAGNVLGRPWRWLHPVARRYVETFGGQTRPRHEQVVEFLHNDPSFHRAWQRLGGHLTIQSWIAGPLRMQPVAEAAGWNLPAIESAGELAAWFNLPVNELEWYADLKDLNGKSRNTRLNHYTYTLLTKRSGKVRLLEAPKQHLRGMQRRILAEILNRIPVHENVHGFVRGRSIQSFAAPHVNRAVVLRMDIEDFFPSFSGRRIQAFFRTVGYPEAVADILGGLCTNAMHLRRWSGQDSDALRAPSREVRELYGRPHLPQGAPTSPALANLCCYRLDCRLQGLAESAGATYTRYADDLAFSGDGDFARRVGRFSTSVAAILLESGFAVNHHKTRIMRRSVRQKLVGLVTNERLNVPREEFDRLKATLTNCIRLGWHSQNREGHGDFRAHLAGRVGFFESVNEAKGLRLRRLLNQIEW